MPSPFARAVRLLRSLARARARARLCGFGHMRACSPDADALAGGLAGTGAESTCWRACRHGRVWAHNRTHPCAHAPSRAAAKTTERHRVMTVAYNIIYSAEQVAYSLIWATKQARILRSRARGALPIACPERELRFWMSVSCTKCASGCHHECQVRSRWFVSNVRCALGGSSRNPRFAPSCAPRPAKKTGYWQKNGAYAAFSLAFILIVFASS